MDIEKATFRLSCRKQDEIKPRPEATADLALKLKRAVYEAQTDETVSDIYKSVMEQKQKDYESYKDYI